MVMVLLMRFYIELRGFHDLTAEHITESHASVEGQLLVVVT